MSTQQEIDLEARIGDLERQIAELGAKVNPLYSGGMDRYIHSGYIQWDGIQMRVDNNGQQFQSRDSFENIAMWFVPVLSTNPSSQTPHGYVSGLMNSTSVTLKLRANDGLGNVAQAYVYADDDLDSSAFVSDISNDDISVQTRVTHKTLNGQTWGILVLANTCLRIAPFGADPTGVQGGDMWYRTDTNKFRVRFTGGPTKNMAIEDTLIHGDGSELTVATGAVTITTGYHRVDTESDAASDVLDTVSGGTTGQILVLRAENDARSVVAKDGTGNLKLAGDCTLDNTEDTLTLIYNGTNWLELARSNNGA